LRQRCKTLDQPKKGMTIAESHFCVWFSSAILNAPAQF
jgi:hypothetical protein